MVTLEQARRYAAENHLKNILKSDFFSICSLQAIFASYGVNHWDHRNNTSYQILHALHCIHYKDMTPELRDSLPVLIADALKSCPGFREIIFPETASTVEKSKALVLGDGSVIDAEFTDSKPAKKKGLFGLIFDWGWNK